MPKITCHATRTRRPDGPYVGWIRVSDGAARWTASTGVLRLTRTDALADALALRTEALDTGDAQTQRTVETPTPKGTTA